MIPGIRHGALEAYYYYYYYYYIWIFDIPSESDIASHVISCLRECQSQRWSQDCEQRMISLLRDNNSNNNFAQKHKPKNYSISCSSPVRRDLQWQNLRNKQNKQTLARSSWFALVTHVTLPRDIPHVTILASNEYIIDIINNRLGIEGLDSQILCSRITRLLAWKEKDLVTGTNNLKKSCARA